MLVQDGAMGDREGEECAMATEGEENGGEAASILSLVGLRRRWRTRMRMTVVAGGTKQQPTP